MDIWDILPWIEVAVTAACLIWGIIGTIREDGVRYLWFICLIIAGVISLGFIWGTMSDVLQSLAVNAFSFYLHEETAAVISAVFLISVVLALYFLVHRLRKKDEKFYKKLLWKPEARRRANAFRKLLIDVLENTEDKRWPSCKDIVLQEADNIISRSEKAFLSFDAGYNYEELALNILKNIAAEKAASGKYHVYTGVLTWMGQQLQAVAINAAQEARSKGYLSEADYQDFIQSMSYGIKTLG